MGAVWPSTVTTTETVRPSQLEPRLRTGPGRGTVTVATYSTVWIVVTLGEDGLTGTATLGQKDHQLDDKSDRAGNTTVGGRENTIVTCVFSCALSCLVQLSCSSMSLVFT